MGPVRWTGPYVWVARPRTTPRHDRTLRAATLLRSREDLLPVIIKTERRTGPERRQAGRPFGQERPPGARAGATAAAHTDEAGGGREPMRVAWRGAPRLRLRHRSMPYRNLPRLRLLRG